MLWSPGQQSWAWKRNISRVGSGLRKRDQEGGAGGKVLDAGYEQGDEGLGCPGSLARKSWEGWMCTAAARELPASTPTPQWGRDLMSKDSTQGGEGKSSDLPGVFKWTPGSRSAAGCCFLWLSHCTKGKNPFVQLQKCPLVHGLALGTFVTAVPYNAHRQSSLG